MVLKNEIHDWWTKALLGEQVSSHPVFGNEVRIDVDGPVVTVSGEVDDAEQAEELEAEARQIPTVEKVVNRLTVLPNNNPCHLQTVIGVFDDAETGKLALQAVGSWKFRDEDNARLLETPGDARQALTRLGKAAQVPGERIERLVQYVDDGKVLLVDHVPEEDALRIVSALEGTPARNVHTLPPEPDACVQE